jgi:hypothetical protein
MPVFGDVRVISESLEGTYKKLKQSLAGLEGQKQERSDARV